MTPESSLSPLGRGMRLLAAGRYAEGWPLYEARRQFMSPPPPTPVARQPEWLGEPVAGRRIVVCAEQGWGDQLMFGRYLGQLRERGADVVVACHPFVIGRFFASLGHAVSPFFIDRAIPDGDYWSLIGSLPLRLGAAPPPPPVYRPLELPREGGIGVVARGSPTHWNDANRSLPAPMAERLLALGRDLSPEATGAHDLLHTAEMMARLDLVITVDTAAAHLAGAIGKACWVLLPHAGLDWRWGDGVRSDWFPAMRLFRQPAPGDWGSVLDAVEQALAARETH
jgi:hypothetical protein